MRLRAFAFAVSLACMIIPVSPAGAQAELTDQQQSDVNTLTDQLCPSSQIIAVSMIARRLVGLGPDPAQKKLACSLGKIGCDEENYILRTVFDHPQWTPLTTITAVQNNCVAQIRYLVLYDPDAPGAPPFPGR